MATPPFSYVYFHTPHWPILHPLATMRKAVDRPTADRAIARPCSNIVSLNRLKIKSKFGDDAGDAGKHKLTNSVGGSGCDSSSDLFTKFVNLGFTSVVTKYCINFKENVSFTCCISCPI